MFVAALTVCVTVCCTWEFPLEKLLELPYPIELPYPLEKLDAEPDPEFDLELACMGRFTVIVRVCTDGVTVCRGTEIPSSDTLPVVSAARLAFIEFAFAVSADAESDSAGVFTVTVNSI